MAEKQAHANNFPARIEAYEKQEQVGADLWRGVCKRDGKVENVLIKVVMMEGTDTSDKLKWPVEEFKDVSRLMKWRQVLVEEVVVQADGGEEETNYNLWLIYDHVLLSLRPLVTGKRVLSEDQIKVILKSLTLVVNELHQRDYILTDIGLDNILLAETGQVLVSHCALPGFNAVFDIWRPPGIDPEETSFEYDKASDIWAIGMVSLQLAFKADYVKKGEIPVLPEIGKCSLSKEFIEFIKGCMQPIPEKRLSAEKLLTLPFFAKVPDKIASPNDLASKVKNVQKMGRFLVTEKPESQQEPTIILNQSALSKISSVQQIKQLPVFNVPVETYVGETDTHHCVVLRTLPGTEVHAGLEGRVLIIKGTFPALAIPEDVRLLEKKNTSFEKRLKFANDAQINPNECIMTPSKEGAIIIKIGKFQSRDIGSITVGSSSTATEQNVKSKN